MKQEYIAPRTDWSCITAGWMICDSNTVTGTGEDFEWVDPEYMK